MVAQAWTAKVARTGTSGSVAIASVKVSCGGRLSDHFGSYRSCPAECWPTQGSELGLTGNPTFAGFYERRRRSKLHLLILPSRTSAKRADPGKQVKGRSEEHTSELQSLMRISYAVF